MINTTLITGSTSGIGKQIGIDLVKKGHYVIFTGRSLISLQKLDEELEDKLWCYPNYCILSPIDFSQKSSIETIQKFLSKKDINIDNLILNVGATCRESLNTITMDEWDKVINTNLTIPFFLIQSILEKIKKRIIFIGSVAGHIPNVVSIPYGVSKGSLEILTQYLARDLADKKITVNTIAPGYINTNWHDKKQASQLDRIKKQNLLNRLGTPEEVSNVCQMIIENEYINGQTICVDGGFHLE